MKDSDPRGAGASSLRHGGFRWWIFRGKLVGRWCGLLLGVVLLGCQPPAPLPLDTLVVGQSGEARSLDPHVATATNDFRIAANIYEGLVRFREGTLEVEPALARSWEISEEGTTYTFHLRPGVVFHDGTPFDAAAVRFNFERLLDPEHPQAHTGPFPLSFFFDSITEIETPDALTVVLHLEKPFAPLLSNLAYPTGFLVSPTAVERHSSAFSRNPAGTGPFSFVEWQSHRLVRLQRFDDYWDRPAKLREIIFRPLGDENARLTALLTGECDLVVEVPPDVVSAFRQRPGFRVLETAGPHLWFLILNTREGPFVHQEMRLAANLAINRPALITHLLQDTATQAAGPIPEAFAWATDPEVSPLPYDPEAARRLVEKMGFSGTEITLYATEGGSGMLAPREMAAAIQADLTAVGLPVRIESFEWNAYLDRVNSGLAGQADMAQMAWMVNDPDTLPYLALRTAAHPEHGGFNSGYYSNPQVDAWIEAARRSTDPEERARLYRKIQRLVQEDAPWVFVASWKQNAALRDTVRGLVLQPSFLLLLKDTWKENPTP